MGDGYVVRIERTGGIPFEEWQAAAIAAGLRVDGSYGWRGPSGAVRQFDCFGSPDGPSYVYDPVTGSLLVRCVEDGWLEAIAAMAERLGAAAIGDDGERYRPGGRVEDRPPPPEDWLDRLLPDSAWMTVGGAVIGSAAIFMGGLWALRALLGVLLGR